MKFILKHFAGFSASTLLLSVVAGLDGIGHALASSQVPLIGASFALSGVISLLFGLTILAPVASIANYLTEHRLSVHWLLEPLVLLGVLLGYASVPLLIICRGQLMVTTLLIVALFLPALTYYLVLRALGFRECL
ncbi:hypothetical protein [Verrucomicrobium sp. BvORR106]|uniref:hypothetical protein n=1 Tax=Verrucomicrobium sp. BvORR106 TaxID=1403819 RepID=UPI00056DCB6D|nr:hypothetical protein [Verrucomicrobium sp. BvORR106]